MLSAQRPVVYWDSCCYLSYLENHPDRVDDLAGVLEDAERGKLSIVTSTISLAEVAYIAAEKINRSPDPAIESQIDKLWSVGSVTTVVELYRHIGVEARSLMRHGLIQGWSGLRANDAIHLATARLYSATAFHTYDEKLSRYGPALKMTIGPPPKRPAVPTQMELLPTN